MDTIAEVSAAGAGQSLEIDREIVLAEADGGPHGFDAAGCDAVEAGVSNLVINRCPRSLAIRREVQWVRRLASRSSPGAVSNSLAWRSRLRNPVMANSARR